MSSSNATYELILKIRHVDHKFRRARGQIVILNNRIDALLVRYKRSGRDKRKPLNYAGRLQIATVEGVRNMYYEYAKQQCEVMDELQTELKAITGAEYDDFEEF